MRGEDALATIRDSSSTTEERTNVVNELSQGVESGRPSNFGRTDDVRTAAGGPITGGGTSTARTTIVSDTGDITQSTTRATGNSFGGSTLTRNVDVGNDRSTVVGNARTNAFGYDGSYALSEAGVVAFGDCEFTNVNITGSSTTDVSDAFTKAFTDFDCTHPDCVDTPVSIVFVTDESGSINSSEFNDVKTFIAEIIGKVNDASEIAYV